MRVHGAIMAGLALVIAEACTDDPSNPDPGTPVSPTVDSGGASDTGASDAGSDAPLALPHPLDAADPTKGSFGSALGVANALLMQGIGRGMAGPERAVIAGDPLFIGAALDRIRFSVAPGCQPAVSQFACPPDTEAAALLGQVLSSRADVKSALVDVTRALQRWRWLGAAATALEYVHVLEQLGKLDPAAKAKIAPLVSAFEAAAAGLETYRFTDHLGNAVWLKAIYSLSEPAFVPTSAMTDAARAIAQAVRSLYATSAFASFDAAGTRRPMSGTAAWGAVTRMSRLGSLEEVDPAVAVEAYLVSVDGIIAKAQSNATDSIDWAGYVSSLSELTRPIDESLNTIDHLAPPPPLEIPTPAPDIKGKGTLEDDPRVFFFGKPVVEAIMPDTTAVGVHLSVQNEFDGLVKPVAPMRVPSHQLGRAIPARTVALDPAYTSYETACGDDSGSKTPCDALWVRWLLQTSSTTVDHVDLRITRASDQKQVFHHVYRPRPDGTLARATLFYPQIDDPDLAKNATTIYAVELVTVGASGVNHYVCASTYVTNGAPPSADKLKSACDVTRLDTTLDYFSDPLATSGFIVQVVDGVLKMRPPVIATPLAGGTVTVWNETGDVHRIASLFTPPYGEVADIDKPLADAINNIPRFETGLLPAHEKKVVATTGLTKGPFLWTLGEPSHRGALGGVIAK